MAHTTLTLASSGRLNSTNLGGTPSASTSIIIPSGMVGVIPYKTSLVAYEIQCLGSGSTQGRIGVPAGADYASILKLSVGFTNGLRIVSVGKLERVAGTTLTPKGGGAF